VPLKHGSEVMGTLEVLTREVRHFTLEEQAVMAAFADQAAAVAISNARLYEQARAHLLQVTEVQAAGWRSWTGCASSTCATSATSSAPR